MKAKKKMTTNFSISNHFITRFNERYLNRPEQWVKSDLKGYLNAIMTSGQIRKFNKYSNNRSVTPRVVGLGLNHSLIMANNNLITVIKK